MNEGQRTRLRHLMSAAAAQPGKTVRISPDIEEAIHAEIPQAGRDEILAIRQRERGGHAVHNVLA